MKNNVIIKSMLRQPMRTALLSLIIAIASFMFVLRAMEFIVVRGRISVISQLFQTQSVGILTHRDGPQVDISQAIELISQNPYVAFYDRRRGFEGNLIGMQNAYSFGSRYWMSSLFYNNARYEFTSRGHVALMPRLRPMEGFGGFANGDAFFYGTLADVTFESWPFFHVLLHVEVDYVVAGYADRVFEGQVVRLMYHPPEDPADSRYINMEIGQRYFLKATQYFFYQFRTLNTRLLLLDPKPIGENGPWYIPVNPGERIDTAALGICREIELAQHVQSAMYIRTTRDMNNLPPAQENLGLMSLLNGRFIDIDDYINAHEVVVVHRHFAERREIRLGDTITVHVNSNSHLVYSPYYVLGTMGDMDPYPWPIAAFPEFGVLGVPGYTGGLTLELEVVGIFDLLRWTHINTGWSSINKFMYIPDSLLPDYWGLQSAYFGDIAPDYAPALWFNFLLYDQRDRDVFMLSVQEALGDMGLRVSFFGREGVGFWEVAGVITLSSMVNLVMFTVVLALVLALAVLLFMWQRLKEYAILRALGMSAFKVYVHLTMALIIFGLPAVMLGSTAGWLYSARFSANTVAGFSEIVADAIGVRFPSTLRAEIISYYMDTSLPPVSQLLALSGVVLIIMLAFITASNIAAANRSVIEALRRAK